MKSKEAFALLKKLGLTHGIKWRGETALLVINGGMAGAKKVAATLAKAEGMGFQPTSVTSLCSPSGSSTGQSSTLMLGTVELHTSCVYGVTKAHNRFMVMVKFPSRSERTSQ